ncbi:unnamed protein product [marine sediment metagenome]|uniref:Uncharacterized protein n=1 Tax=marine sediment metagenome TaxID=412755 RepID=X1KM20_9ZZZZ
MPLIRIQKDKGIKHVFIAGELIADLASVELLPGERQVRMGRTGDEHLAAGVARGEAASGDLARVITQGIVSGILVASGQPVAAGDRLTIATLGAVVPFNTAGGVVSGLTGSGHMIMSGLGGGILSGYASINTGRVLGKALTSGGAGSGIQMLVCLE